MNESAVTGESAPVIRESGGDRSAVTGGTLVLSDRLVIRVTARPGESFVDRMIALVEGAKRQKTPNEIALDVLLAGLTIVFLIAVVTLVGLASWHAQPPSVPVLIALFVTLIPTTIGGLLSAIGIAGMDRLVRFNVIATSGRAVEAAGDVDTLLLDKTGTITFGNRMADAFAPSGGASERELAEAAFLSSLSDETPEGRSIVELAAARFGFATPDLAGASFVPFARADADLGGRPRRAPHPQGSRRQRAEERSNGAAAGVLAAVERSRARAARRWRSRRTVGCSAYPSQGRREARHQGALRAAARDGHPHRDGHGRQPSHRGRHRDRGGRRRLHRGSHAAGQS